MNVNELRLGNWVKIGDEESAVDYLNLLTNQVGLQGNAVMNQADDIEGIPLTKELLASAGFKRHKAGAGGADMWQGMDGWSRGNGDWMFRGDPKCLHLVGYFNTQIRFLHELQNLYHFLTGEELKINV